MILSFDNILGLIATNLFGGSTTLAGLALLLVCWGICAVICINMRASPVYSVVPLIPLCIFFSAYGVLNETIAIIIILVSAVLVASEFRKVVG